MIELPEIPFHMRLLPLDSRGYPIPFIVMRDSTGKPHFTVNDETKRMLCFKHDLCGICGNKLTTGRWFIGGPLSAFDPHGFFVDPPMHAGCARFALQVCPYLANDHWADKSIAGKSFGAEEREKLGVALVEYTMLPGRPTIFVAAMAHSQRLYGDGLQTYVYPARPYRNVEYWRHGQRVDDETGRREVVQAVLEYARKQGRPLDAVDLPGMSQRQRPHPTMRRKLRMVR